LETVNQREFSDDLRETPALLLSEDVEKLRKNFSISLQEKTAGTEQFTLTPKVTEGLFQQLVLVFKAGQLAEFVIQDTLGQITRCELTHVKRNQTLAEEKFFFIPPTGVEIIKN
jgi:outer membrane lipoprotein carrier protein